MAGHMISVIVRDDAGKLRVVSDHVSIDHTDDHAELDTVVANRITFGDAMVMVLFDDDSVARHWTRPASSGQEAGAAAPDVVKPKRRQAQPKKKSKHKR